MKSKFGQLSLALKLVVIWLFLVGLGSFWRFGIDIRTKHILDLGSLISGMIEWGLAVGLINRSNESRWWATFFAFLGFLFGFFALAILVFEDPNPAKGLQILTSIPKTEATIFIVSYIILNAGTLITLTRPVTKSFFTLQTAQEGEQ